MNTRSKSWSSCGGELVRLRQRLLRMVDRVEEFVGQALDALLAQDAARARGAVTLDRGLNRDQVELDEMAFQIQARCRLTSGDLRFVQVASKMSTDLERMGDLARDICEVLEDDALEPPLTLPDELVRMTRATRALVHDALNSFVNADSDAARELNDRDDEVDGLQHELDAALVQLLQSDPAQAEEALAMHAVGIWLERIADHATNVGEYAVFLMVGLDIRHAEESVTHPNLRIP